MKVFISQCMANRETNEIEAEREALVKQLVNKGYEVLNSVITTEPGENIKNVSVWYLGKSLEILAEADIAYFMKGWQRGRGCRIERKVAEDYGIQIIEE